MSSINNQNMLSPMQANNTEITTMPADAPTLYASANNAYSYDWFNLPDSNRATGPIAQSSFSAINGIAKVNGELASIGSMESRVERIIQFILPRA